VDAEQIRRQMSVTRASIDRKIDLLAARTAVAKQDAARKGMIAAATVAAFAVVVAWWRRRARIGSRRRLIEL
jgi:hypothetical protein